MILSCSYDLFQGFHAFVVIYHSLYIFLKLQTLESLYKWLLDRLAWLRLFRKPWYPKKVYGSTRLVFVVFESGWMKFWTCFKPWKWFLQHIQTRCKKNENVGNSVTFGLFLAKYLENTLRDEAVAENGDKNKLITKEIRFLWV